MPGSYPAAGCLTQHFSAFRSVLSQFRAQYSLVRADYTVFGTLGQFCSGQHQQIIGDDGTPDVPAESLPTFPSATVKTKGTLEDGDPGLDACPEVA